MHLLSKAAAAIRLHWRTLRLQLALLYAGTFVALGAALLAVSGLLVRSGSVSVTGSSSSQSTFTGRQFNVGPALVFAGTVLVALALGWLIAGRFMRPLRTITATARDISASNLNRRLALSGRNDEFAELGETLDGLFGRLEASFQAQRHFVANASHELRTPLAAERTLLQVALADPDATAQTLRETCEELLALGDQQERLIEALLTLASSERGVERWEPFDLAEIAGKVLLNRRQEAERRGIRVDGDLSAAPATGDPSLAESLLANLVDNAIRQPRRRLGQGLNDDNRRAGGRIGQQHRTDDPARRGGPPLPAVPATRHRAHAPCQRSRARPRHRPRHHRRPQRHTHRKCPA